MKTLALRGMFAAAALMVVAGVASAQTYRAEVPMPFRAGGNAMAPGSYSIKISASESYRAILYNSTDRKSAILLGTVLSDPPKAWLASGSPKVTFQCSNGACSLKSIWSGTGSYVQSFPTPNPATLTAHRPELVTLSMIEIR